MRTSSTRATPNASSSSSCSLQDKYSPSSCPVAAIAESWRRSALVPVDNGGVRPGGDAVRKNLTKEVEKTISDAEKGDYPSAPYCGLLSTWRRMTWGGVTLAGRRGSAIALLAGKRDSLAIRTHS
jgi:hypothetical protein